MLIRNMPCDVILYTQSRCGVVGPVDLIMFGNNCSGWRPQSPERQRTTTR